MVMFHHTLWFMLGLASPSIPSGEMVRVARLSPASALTVSGAAGWRTDRGKGGSASVSVRLRGGRLEVRQGSSWGRASWLVATPRPGGSIAWGGAVATGSLRLQVVGGRLLGIESLALEQYVAGVVRAEMGRVGEGSPEALAAQAILARTYVARNRGKYAPAPYDLWASVRDQAYAPDRSTASPFAVAARATEGLVLRDSTGSLADIFYHSTCGGRTERGADIFSGAQRSYLPSVSDIDAATGRAYCADSPHFQWEYELQASALLHILRRASAVAVVDTSVSGRVRGFQLQAGGRSVVLTGHDIRARLGRSAAPLRSTAFRVATRRGDSWQLEGGGWGHGVGMCQYGAIGRAQAGATYADILSAYFPGTHVSR